AAATHEASAISARPRAHTRRRDARCIASGHVWADDYSVKPRRIARSTHASRSAARTLQSGQPVDAGAILLVPVGADAVRSLALRPLVQLPALAHEGVVGDRVAAGVADAFDGHANHRPRAGLGGEAGREGVEFGIARHDHAAAAVEADDLGRPLE